MSPAGIGADAAASERSAATAPRPVVKTGYRAVAADRVLVRVLAIVALLVAVSGSQLDAAFPMYATTAAGVGTRVIGIAFAANTLTVVLLQLVVLHKLRGRRRTRALMITCLLSAVCWLLTLLAGHVGGGVPAAATLILALIVVGIGETFWSPSTPGIVNDLAPDRLRARYNAMLGFADAGGALIGPPLAGLVIGAGVGGRFLIAIAVACVLTVLAVRNLERVLPHAANIVGGEEAVLATAAAEPLSPTL